MNASNKKHDVRDEEILQWVYQQNGHNRIKKKSVKTYR